MAEDDKNTAKIAELNDRLRTTFNPLAGIIVTTPGVTALKNTERAAVFNLIKTFNNFSEDNDPHGEHDFGAVEVADRKYFWKIDYYDKSMRYLSEDPADAGKTNRVMTIMCAHEY